VAVNTPFLEAAVRLGVGTGADRAQIRAAYKKLAVLHPPDRDPEGFRTIREAYELLTEPGHRTAELLLRTTPMAEPPRPPEIAGAPRGATALAVLRLLAGRADVSALFPAAPPEGPERMDE
jgi:curved DNA-binding protein CbpA